MGTYLVTGGAGFIGSHIVSALVARGDRVRVLDNLMHRPSAERRRAFKGDVEFVEGDLVNPRDVERALDRRRGRVSPGGIGFGAAQRGCAAGYERRVRDGHGHAARCGPANAACGESCLPARAASTATSPRRPSTRICCRCRCRRMRPRRSPANSTARRSPPRMAWKRSRSDTSTCSARGKIRRANTRP